MSMFALQGLLSAHVKLAGTAFAPVVQLVQPGDASFLIFRGHSYFQYMISAGIGKEACREKRQTYPGACIFGAGLSTLTTRTLEAGASSKYGSAHMPGVLIAACCLSGDR